MTRLRQVMLPGYLLLCLLVGGSSQAIWGNAILQILAVGILAWAALTSNAPRLPRSARPLLTIVGALLLLILAQTLPLPPSIWTAIPGRQFVADGFRQLGMALPWMPSSLAPYDTLTTAMTLLPPLAVLVGMLRLRDWRMSWMLGAIVMAAVLSVLVGILQVTGSNDAWYFYRITNLGVAVGTFANGNHFATLLLVAIPALAAVAASGLRSDNRQQRGLAGACAAAAAAALAIGAIMNSSAAFLLLGPPVAAASVLLAMRLPQQRVRQAVLAIVLLLVIAGGSVAILGDRFPGWGTNASIETRIGFWTTTLEATKTEGLAGSGFGTFEKAYSRYEDPAVVDRFYVNHAHNDYLELALEGGVPAVILIVAFLIWWAGRARSAWFSASSSAEQKAAAVMSAAILLHSLFDYPLRTAAIMAAMATALAILAGAKGTIRPAKPDEQRARHATL